MVDISSLSWGYKTMTNTNDMYIYIYTWWCYPFVFAGVQTAASIDYIYPKP
jgi:hypothetical protein